jgi:hypothetical protein
MNGLARSIATTLRPESRDVVRSDAQSQRREFAPRHGGRRLQRLDCVFRALGAESQSRCFRYRGPAFPKSVYFRFNLLCPLSKSRLSDAIDPIGYVGLMTTAGQYRARNGTPKR